MALYEHIAYWQWCLNVIDGILPAALCSTSAGSGRERWINLSQCLDLTIEMILYDSPSKPNQLKKHQMCTGEIKLPPILHTEMLCQI